MRRFLSLLFIIGLSFAAQGATIKKGSATFHVDTKPLNIGGGIDGTAPITGTPKIEGGKLSGTFIVNAMQFVTGNDKRDSHLKEWLAKNKCGDGKVELEPVDMNGTQPIKGQFSFCGKTIPISGKGDFKGNSAKVEFGFDLKKDLGLDPATAVFEKVGATEKISVTADLELVP